MEVIIEDDGIAKVPFRAIFEINSKEDAIKFHDLVAIKIGGNTEDLIAEAYSRCGLINTCDKRTFII